MAEPLVPLGEIVTTHGLNGWLKLNCFNLSTTAIASGVAVVLQKADDLSAHRIEAARRHRSQMLIKLTGVDSIDAAAALVGSVLCLLETELESLAPGQYYHYQVIGFEVVTIAGERVGEIISTLDTAGGELYVVGGGEREHLIPAVKEFIERVDFRARRMIINPPDGLLDL
jgi:16S rRNA processing protein RimM